MLLIQTTKFNTTKILEKTAILRLFSFKAAILCHNSKIIMLSLNGKRRRIKCFNNISTLFLYASQEQKSEVVSGQ